jgi:hypothetical protein
MARIVNRPTLKGNGRHAPLRTNPRVAARRGHLQRLAQLALQDRLDQSGATIPWEHRMRASRAGRLKIAAGLVRLEEAFR